MRAKIIAVTNQKGGCGKTNIAVNLAGALIRRGHKVYLIDADPQGTATIWVNNAPDDSEIRIPVNGLGKVAASVSKEVRKYVDDYDVIIVDCPPAAESPVPQSMMLVSDLALVPIIPNPGDLWAAQDILELASRCSDTNDELNVRLVASIVRPNLALTKAAIEQMASMRVGMPLMKTMINQRTAYAEAMISGDSVHVLGSSAKAAIEEVENLTNDVSVVLGLKKGRK